MEASVTHASIYLYRSSSSPLSVAHLASPAIALLSLCLHHQEEGSKFLEIDVFADICVLPRDELTKSLHGTVVEKGQSVVQESTSQLPPDTPIESMDPFKDTGFHILTEMLDQTFSRRLGTYCQGMGNVRRQESGAS
ncbi:uncharacterized protein LOC126609365 [Malus sylvestris]|uniref:uncharacterized protein LOC126609365 n=1 Tax=Malus sylvestris TaxID=3752 RepID=UPI0021AD1A64|nr:uncharacterized protein LOC126609365 [Malus sylvestris]